MAMSSNKNHYQILGVSNDAEDIVIRAAYKVLAQRYHPDKSYAPQEEAAAMMQSINGAYDILSDPIKRANYDEELKRYEEPQQANNKTQYNQSTSSHSGQHYSDNTKSGSRFTNLKPSLDEIGVLLVKVAFCVLLLYSTGNFLSLALAELNPLVFGANNFILWYEAGVDHKIDSFYTVYYTATVPVILGILSLIFAYRKYNYTEYIVISFFTSLFILLVFVQGPQKHDIWALVKDLEDDKLVDLFKYFLFSDMAFPRNFLNETVVGIIYPFMFILVLIMPFFSFVVSRTEHVRVTYSNKVSSGLLIDIYNCIRYVIIVGLVSGLIYSFL